MYLHIAEKRFDRDKRFVVNLVVDFLRERKLVFVGRPLFSARRYHFLILFAICLIRNKILIEMLFHHAFLESVICSLYASNMYLRWNVFHSEVQLSGYH